MSAPFTTKVFNYVQERISSTSLRERVNSQLVRFLPAALPLREDAAELLAKLRERGNVFVPCPLDSARLRALRDDLSTRQCFDPWRRHLGTFALKDVPEGTNNAHICGVHKAPGALEIANDPLVLSVVSNYLGCLPTIDDILAWWSLPGRPAPIQEQFFHRDRDAIRFVKLFVYLSDVSDADGPHVFVRGTHRTEHLTGIRRRYQDAEVLAHFSDDQIDRYAGPFGTCFLEDTYGLHKGDLPSRTSPRLLLQVRYTSFPSNFTGPPERLPAPPHLNRYVNRLLFS